MANPLFVERDEKILVIGPTEVTWVKLMGKKSSYSTRDTYYTFSVKEGKVFGDDKHQASGIKKHYEGTLKNHFFHVLVDYSNGQQGWYSGSLNPISKKIKMRLKLTKGTGYNSIQGDIASMIGQFNYYVPKGYPQEKQLWPDINDDKLLPILCGREFCPDSPFYKEYFPLDIFKYIVYLSYLHMPAVPERKLKQYSQQILEIAQQLPKVREEYALVTMGGTCYERKFCSPRIESLARMLEKEILERYEEINQLDKTIKTKEEKACNLEKDLTAEEREIFKQRTEFLKQTPSISSMTPIQKDKFKELTMQAKKIKTQRKVKQRKGLFNLQALLEQQRTWIQLILEHTTKLQYYFQLEEDNEPKQSSYFNDESDSSDPFSDYSDQSDYSDSSDDFN